MEFKLPYGIKEKIFNDIISFDNPFGLNNSYNLVDFLSKLLDLKNLPSDDLRFENAYEDAVQHIINNNDWDYKYTFIDRFKILESNDLFKRFLEILLNNIDEDNRIVLTSIINNYINKFNYFVRQTHGLNGILSVIEELDLRYNFSDIPDNNIPFFVKKDNEKLDIKTYPCFVLSWDSWDDYNYKTRFNLYYYDNNKKYFHFGRIKIMKLGELITYDVIEKEFYKLTADFCSLSVSENFYFELKEVLKENYISVLAALNDSGYFPSICEKFENESGFQTSLCRNEKEAEKIIRTIRYKLTYGDISNLFNFEFIFTPLYSTHSTNFVFDFDGKKTIPKRVFSIIGKNGVGKTMLIKDLLVKLSEKNTDRIVPHIPLYGKILVTSFGYFDAFEDIKNRLDFNFQFCGLLNLDENRPLKNDEIKSKLIISINKISEKNALNKFYFIIKEFIDNVLIDELIELPFLPNEIIDFEFLRDNDFLTVNFKYEKISNVIDKLSSGQLALFYIITEIIANIRYNSLLIFDEPETHLHPNAITEFMAIIMHLLEEFDSYCIIATHSPLIVREVFSNSIYVFEKDDNIPRARKLEFETFGENLSTITDEIFGNRDVSKYYIKTIENIVNEGMSYEEIENLIGGEVPLNLNVKILIKSLVKNRDEES